MIHSFAIGQPPHTLHTLASPSWALFNGSECSEVAMGDTFDGMGLPNNLRIRPTKCFRHLSGSSIFIRNASSSASKTSNSAVSSGIPTTQCEVSFPLHIDGNLRRVVRAKPYTGEVIVN